MLRIDPAIPWQWIRLKKFVDAHGGELVPLQNLNSSDDIFGLRVRLRMEE